MPRKTSRYALETFLRQLARTGNFALAADLAGLAKSGLFKRRARDPAFAAACDAALLQAGQELTPVRPEEALSKVEVPSRRASAAQPLLTTPGSIHLSTYAGRAQLRRLAPGCLTQAGLAAFLANLAATCNVRLSAERVGVRHSSIHRRGQRDSQFAEAMAQAIADAAVELEGDLLESVNHALESMRERAEDDRSASDGQDIDQGPPRRITGEIGFQEALQLLILHRNAFGTPRTKHDRRQADHNARYGPPPLSDDEMRAKLVKGLVAFGKRIKEEG